MSAARTGGPTRLGRALPAGSEGAGGEGAGSTEPCEEGSAAPTPEPADGERERAGGTSGEGAVRTGDTEAGDREAVRAGTRTGDGPREREEVPSKRGWVGAETAGTGGEDGGATTTGGTGEDAELAATGADVWNSRGYASARVLPSGNFATISPSESSSITQGTRRTHSGVAKRMRALWASRTNSTSSASVSIPAERGDRRRRA